MTDKEKETLWIDYKRTNDRDLRNKIIVEYAPLVKIIAGKLMISIGEHVEFDDVCSMGTLGLIDAIDKFDLSKNIKFETYASLRIRGTILDEIRKQDIVSRATRTRFKKYEKNKLELYSKLGRFPTDEELRESMDLTIEEYNQFINDLPITNLVSLDEHLEMGEQINENIYNKNIFETPNQYIDKLQLSEILNEALNKLTEKEKNVIILHYYEDLTIKEISSILEVTESRISQLHSKALSKMRPYINLYSLN